jgi:hypothetical protein
MYPAGTRERTQVLVRQRGSLPGTNSSICVSGFESIITVRPRSGRGTTTITANKAGCAEAVRKAERTNCPFMAVHRRALAKMDEKARTIVAKFWHAHGLFPSVNDATRFLRDPNRTYQNSNGRVFPRPTGYLIFLIRQRWKTASTEAQR